MNKRMIKKHKKKCSTCLFNTMCNSKVAPLPLCRNKHYVKE